LIGRTNDSLGRQNILKEEGQMQTPLRDLAKRNPIVRKSEDGKHIPKANDFKKRSTGGEARAVSEKSIISDISNIR
jgi:hypothetical protein